MTWRRILLATVAAAFGFVAQASARLPVVGQPAPPFQVVTLDGEPISLADLRGQVVILNFWATWCVPCRKELPLLDGYYKLRQAAGLRVVAVTTQDSTPLYILKPFAAHLAMKLAWRLRGDYVPLGGIPTNYVIDRGGVLRYARVGAFDLDELNRIVQPLLNETAPPPPTSIAAK